MAHTESITKSNSSPINLLSHPAHIWAGMHNRMTPLAIEQFQNLWCKQNGCKACAICTQIQDGIHHNLLWLKPTKQYVLDDIKPIFKTISFSLEENQQFFFVLEQAELLNQACSNSLLKVMEEPPPGYHFLLLTQRLDALLPTIRSRCVITRFDTTIESILNHPLGSCFTAQKQTEPTAFLQALDQAAPNERDSMELLDRILQYWTERYAHALQNNNSAVTQQSLHMLTLIKKSMEQSPMPGSSKIFWKNLFLQMKR